ncbi:MAG TPA: hypothetical protein VFE25_10365 [Opitutaceae bacterium]|nr:hypothetical protein [Opitutaceae bacterium]
MLHKSSRICIAALTALLLSAGTAMADQDNSKALIDLLVKKGLLSRQDVDSLQAEVAAQASAPATTTTTVTTSAMPSSVQVAAPSGQSPLFFKIGNANFTPFGFLDFTGVYRNEATGSAIGTGFNSIPYSNQSVGQLSETKFSAQNSRLGLKVESAVNDTKVLGYVETDFLGNAPTNLGVSSNSDTLRVRVYFADFRNGPWEFLAGQDWSMLTPNRKGISPIPGDIFYTNDMDTNYQAGLTWARQPQVRVVYHATDEFTLGLSVENPDQYVGSAVVLPSAFTATEVDQGTATTQPNAFPDVVIKGAYDTKAITGLPWHFEVAGLARSYKINTYSSTLNSDATAEGGGISAALNLELVKGFTLVGTGFYSYGGGRYINGLGPDFIVKAPDASGAYGIGLVKATSAIVGAEWAVAPQDTISAYWSTAGFGQRYSKLSNGTYVGYGYPGSSNSNNKTIDEYTIANTYTFWKNPAYGALAVIGQLSYVDRKPWYVAAGGLTKADATMVFLDLRYTLP